MALSKKYANLPDLDPAPEIYETPELVDDASTVQTGTLRTESPSPSDEGRHDPDAGLDHQRINREEARRRFEPAVVDARDVDFSDKVGGSRKSYKSAHRRRRRRENGAEELGDFSGSEEETLPAKIARLRREAEEVRLELERKEEGEFKEAVEDQNDSLENGAQELSKALSGLPAPTSDRGAYMPEEDFARRLASTQVQPPVKSPSSLPPEPLPSTTAAVAAFSDRLTALEAALGISAVQTTDETASILPTLNSLTTQIMTLTSTLTTSHNPSGPTSLQPSTSPLPTLDAIATRIRTLTAESDKLALSRKEALKSLTELHEARNRHSSYAHHGSRPTSSHNRVTAPDQELDSQLFLDEQSAKISALYQTLPTIQNLTPLLPVVLERLKSLSVVHAGAAGARAEMDEVERRQEEVGRELERWREAVRRVEAQMKEMESVMKGNVEVVGAMVKGVEEKVARLERR